GASSIRTVRYSAAAGMKAAGGRTSPRSARTPPVGTDAPTEKSGFAAPDRSAIMLPDAGLAGDGQDRAAGLRQRRLRDRTGARRSTGPLGREGLPARRGPGLEAR